MNGTSWKVLPGLLMLGVAILFMGGATFVAEPMTAPSYVLSALAIMALCMGTLMLLRVPRLK